MPSDTKPRPDATGCLLLDPAQRQRIGLRLDAIDTGLDQLRDLLGLIIEEAVERDGPESHGQDCECAACLGWWLVHQVMVERDAMEGVLRP